MSGKIISILLFFSDLLLTTYKEKSDLRVNKIVHKNFNGKYISITRGECGRSKTTIFKHLTPLKIFRKMAASIIVIGNPGAGKSTILNSLAGENLFKSGVSI